MTVDTSEGPGGTFGEFFPPWELIFGATVAPESGPVVITAGIATLDNPVVITGTIPASEPLTGGIMTGTTVDPAPELEITGGTAVEPVLIFVDIPTGTTPTLDELRLAGLVAGILSVPTVDGPVEMTIGTALALVVTTPVTLDAPLANIDVSGAAVGKLKLEADNADVKADTTLVKGFACPEVVVDGDDNTDPTWDNTELTMEVGLPSTDPVPDPTDAIEDTTEFTNDKAELTCDGLGGVEL